MVWLCENEHIHTHTTHSPSAYIIADRSMYNSSSWACYKWIAPLMLPNLADITIQSALRRSCCSSANKLNFMHWAYTTLDGAHCTRIERFRFFCVPQKCLLYPRIFNCPWSDNISIPKNPGYYNRPHRKVLAIARDITLKPISSPIPKDTVNHAPEFPWIEHFQRNWSELWAET